MWICIDGSTMMKLINITGRKAVVDDAYRYKMPEVICSTEGSGNGIKTAFINYKIISDHLQRPADELCKFMEYNLHTQAEETYDRLLINGSFSRDQLQACVHDYIEIFVLCKRCRLPEIVYRYKKKDLMYKCRSCGHRDIIIDKLSKFIVKHHCKTPRDKKKIKKADKQEEDDDDDVVWFTDLSEEAVAKRALENPFA
jgi:translation initiation factor 2 beta subunit (eIF-2beta)/eIF-5